MMELEEMGGNLELVDRRQGCFCRQARSSLCADSLHSLPRPWMLRLQEGYLNEVRQF